MLSTDEGDLRNHIRELEDILASMSDLIDDIAFREPDSATRLEDLYNRLSDVQECLGDLALLALVKRMSTESGAERAKEVLEQLDITDPN